MNFLNLQYFLVLSEELNFSRSASRLYISQQSLSAHIHKLELKYGLQLFYRDPPLRLTEAGEEFLKSARAILNEKEHLEKLLIDFRDFRQGNITIGIPISRGTILLPKVLTAFYQQFPQVKIHLIEGNSNEISSALINGETDLNLGFQIEDSDRVVSELLYVETTKIVVPNAILDRMPNKEEILSCTEPLPLRTFASCPFVGLHENTLTGSELQTTAKADEFMPEIVMDTGNLLTMLSLCCMGIGVCVCPNSFLIDKGPLISPTFLEHVTTFSMQSNRKEKWIAVDRLKNKYLSRAEKALIQIIKETYSDI